MKKIRKYREALSALIKGRVHPSPCECPGCLYDLYRQSPKNRKGHPHSKRLFFMNYLIHEAILDSLEKEGKTKDVFIYGKKRRVIPMKRKKDIELYDRASYYLEVHEILKRLLEEEKRRENKRFLQGLVRYKTYFYRSDAEGFRDLIGELIKKRLSGVRLGVT